MKKANLFISTFFVFLIVISQVLAEQEYQLKTLTNLKFDKEIQDVAFDSYNENGQTKYYPKIVVLREIDSIASKGSYTKYALEVRILDRDGKTIWNLTNLKYWSNVYFSNRGKYFGVDNITYKDPSVDYDNREIISSNFTVYNDKGKTIWQLPIRIDYNNPIISSYDGSVFMILNEEDAFGVGLDLYDKNGIKHVVMPYANFLSDTINTVSRLKVSDDGKFVAAVISRGPSNEMKQHTLTFFDLNGNSLWQYLIPEKANGELNISPKGRFTFIDGRTEIPRPHISKESLIKGSMKLEPPKYSSANIFIINHKGKLIMQTPIRISYTAEAFSINERFLHFCNYTFTQGELNQLILIDLENKKEVFRKEISERPVRAGISDSGWVIEVWEIPDSTRELNKRTIPTSSKFKLCLLNNEGNVITQSEVQLRAEDISNLDLSTGAFRVLGWCGNYTVFGLVEDKSKTIKILSLEKQY